MNNFTSKTGRNLRKSTDDTALGKLTGYHYIIPACWGETFGASGCKVKFSRLASPHALMRRLVPVEGVGRKLPKCQPSGSRDHQPVKRHARHNKARAWQAAAEQGTHVMDDNPANQNYGFSSD